MNILKVLSIAVLLILIGGLGYFALTDVPVQQQDVAKEIPHDRFYD
jgi:hypothetical protein